MAETGTSRKRESQKAVLIDFAIATFYFLASLKLAVALLSILAVVLAWAAVLEKQHDAAYARWYVYGSWWFIGFLGLVGLNIFCSAASRFTWKRHHSGLVVTHAGLLVLLAGMGRSFVSGVEGHVSLSEDQTTQEMLLCDRSLITAFWVGRSQDAPFEFTLDAGPGDWPPGRVLNLGEIDGVKARILGYFENSRAIESWVPDKSGNGIPVVKFRVLGENGAQVGDGWLVDHQFGDAVAIGPIRLQLEGAVTDRMLDDFLQPPTDELGERGLLTMYMDDAVERVALDRKVGQKVSLGNTGVAVEIAKYLPNATPDRLGNFVSKDDRPKNPMVELRVHVPDEKQPLRQIAFAKDPLLNLDGVYPRICPVKFRFRHPAIRPQTTVELMQSSQGRLLARLNAAGAYTPFGELHAGDRLAVPGNFHLEIVEHVPHAKRTVTFEGDGLTTRRKVQDKREPAALVEVATAGTTERVWLRRNDPAHGRSMISTPRGAMALSLENARVPLGYSLRLIDYRPEPNAGSANKAVYSSKVRISDTRRGLDQEHVVTMTEPLTHGNFTFCQSSFDEVGQGQKTSTFNVAYDPGRTLKYIGSVMICLGIVMMFSMRTYFFKTVQT